LAAPLGGRRRGDFVGAAHTSLAAEPTSGEVGGASGRNRVAAHFAGHERDGAHELAVSAGAADDSSAAGSVGATEAAAWRRDHGAARRGAIAATRELDAAFSLAGRANFSE
jgi:hypothetical protein